MIGYISSRAPRRMYMAPAVLTVPEDFTDEPWIVRFEPDSDRVLAIRHFASQLHEHPMPGYSILPGPAYLSPESSAPPL